MRLLRLLILLCIAAPAAQGADDVSPAIKAKAKARIKKARAYYEAGQYAEAITEYKGAYQLTPVPEIIFNVGQISRVKGDKAQAVVFYRKYLQEAPEGRMASEAKKQIAEVIRESVPEALGDRWDKAKAAVDSGKHAGLDEKWAALEMSALKGEDVAAGLEEIEKELKPAPAIAPDTEKQAVAEVVRKKPKKESAPFVPNPIVKKWWFWTAVGGGAVVILAVGLGAGLGGPSDPVPTLGTLR
jgi:tetratricopeptide (TPR) repeat protein